ncbi:hypothetical protein G6F59_016965 [Rhizopus arrhizus]|nr:hypothetical protein G6F59_016965 [Rhizopus arrhizus]
MLAMREVFDVNATTFGQFAVVDVGVGYVWMAALIFLAGRAAKIDARSGADTSAIDELKERIARFQVGAGTEQHADDLHVAGQCRLVQRTAALAITRVGACLVL